MFREFHTLGAATGKAREENTVVAGGCCSSKAEADSRFLVGRYSLRLFVRRLSRPSCFICDGRQLKCYTLSDGQPVQLTSELFCSWRLDQNDEVFQLNCHPNQCLNLYVLQERVIVEDFAICGLHSITSIVR